MPSSKDDLIQEQARMIVQKDKRIAKLEKLVTILRQALNRDLEVQTVIFKDISNKLETLEKPILATILALSKKYQRPVTYPEIIKGFEAKYPFIEAKPPTIRRRVRLLREKGYVMKHGQDSFYPKLTQNVSFNGEN